MSVDLFGNPASDMVNFSLTLLLREVVVGDEEITMDLQASAQTDLIRRRQIGDLVPMKSTLSDGFPVEAAIVNAPWVLERYLGRQ